MYHATGTARRDVSRCLHGNPEARRVRPPLEEEVFHEGEEEVRDEEDRSMDETSGMAANEAQALARATFLNYAEYQVFQRRAI